MRMPIAYTLHFPDRVDLGIEPPDLVALGPFAFERVDEDAFPCLRIAREAALAGGTAPCVLNAANEVAVEAFLDGRLRFGDIARLVEWTLERLPREPVTDLDSLLETDAAARATAGEWLASAAAAR
jgi:1-deoxy-D-xylulose-5-phosphate reductoisomerase